jgi:hypothetical protein
MAQQQQITTHSAHAAAAAVAATSTGSGSRSATAAGGLQLSKETMAVLGVLQKKLQVQLQNVSGNSGMNSQLITNALAVVIAQAAKNGGGINNISNILKDPAQLTQLLQKAMATIGKTKSGSATPAPAVVTGVSSANSTRGSSPNPPKSVGGDVANPPPASHTPVLPIQPVAPPTSTSPPSTTLQAAAPHIPVAATAQQASYASVAQKEPSAAAESTAGSSSQSGAQEHAGTSSSEQTQADVAIQLPEPSPAAKEMRLNQAPLGPPPAGSGSSSQKKPTSAAEIARVLEQASKIPNPSSSVKAALAQLRAKLDAMNAQESRKRPSEESIEHLDSSSVKNFKGAA